MNGSYAKFIEPGHVWTQTLLQEVKLIIDKKEVITGSSNLTDLEQKRNVENLVFISDPKLAKEYIKNWESREHQSIPYLS